METTEILTKNYVKHPLEPLLPTEIQKIVGVIKSSAHVSFTSTRFVSIALKEPPKSEVYNFAESKVLKRKGLVVLFDNATNKCYEAVVDITDGTIELWKHVPSVQPTMTADEQIECEKAVIENDEFKSLLKKYYGIEDTALVMVDIWSVGNYGAEEESLMRLARPLCFLRSDATDNGYARPIEGVRPVVDLNTMKVIRVEDYGYWELPPNPGNYAAHKLQSFRTDIKPLEISQPDGPSFKVDGYKVEWQKWHIVVGFNSREGLTLHNICYNDEGQIRPILYRASLSEMVVPYGDPSLTQRRKNAFDTGEYGMGMCANSLQLGCDCLGYIHYFDAHLTNSRGNPFTIKNAICMHEEDYGILWKHTDRRLDTPEVRRSRRLVISSVSTVENYEYGFFWYFYQDGNIQFEIKLTGILSLGSLPDGVKPKYGTLINKRLYAPNHQHFFNMRLDFDVDGGSNTVYQMDVEVDENVEENDFGNAFYAKSTPMETELQARAYLNTASARYWKIVNEQKLNSMGEPVAYKFYGGDNCMPYAKKDAWWRKRARFVDYHVWVTPQMDEELFAAGNYPNQSKGEQWDLEKWTNQNREIREKDIVFWYTFGHTHIPRPEDWPVMPTAYIGFLLKPHGFFNENPANDVPPSPKNTSKSCCN
jgi:primary-amine oxidase